MTFLRMAKRLSSLGFEFDHVKSTLHSRDMENVIIDSYGQFAKCS